MFPTKVEKTTSKSCLLMAAPPAQNSLEVHFRFTNSPIHSSVLKSVIEAFFQSSLLFLSTKYNNFRSLPSPKIDQILHPSFRNLPIHITYNATHHIVLSLIICNWSLKKSLILVGIEKFYQCTSWYSNMSYVLIL